MKSTDKRASDDPSLRQIQPRPFLWEDVDSNRVAISYDCPSDTLLIHLFGRHQPSVSVPIARYLYALVDPESEQIVGVHVEGFLAQAVKEHPDELAILDHAELRGISPIEVRGLQREILGRWEPLPGKTRAVFAPEVSRDKKEAAMLLMEAENVRWGTRDMSAA